MLIILEHNRPPPGAEDNAPAGALSDRDHLPSPSPPQGGGHFRRGGREQAQAQLDEHCGRQGKRIWKYVNLEIMDVSFEKVSMQATHGFTGRKDDEVRV